GGAMNAHEDDKFPHLKEVVDQVHGFHQAGKPVMGICLGAQLIARAFGSRVEPHTQPELGFSPLKIIREAVTEPWIKVFEKEFEKEFEKNFAKDWTRDPADGFYSMQWHFDSFNLPSAATLLMTNDHCKHQAFRIGSNIYGFQFHFEVTPQIVNSWLAAKQAWIAAHYPGLDKQIRQQLDQYYPQSSAFAAHVAQGWLDLVPVPL
ncbi:MAG: hypothetical protein AAFZ80_14560, partial [Cyanobacteria bacterium P01_A01_bin.105]